MKSVVITNTDQFKVTSWGNGLCYEIISKEREEYIFFQGDDASQFRSEWEAYEQQKPEASINCILSRLWFDYDYALASPFTKEMQNTLKLEKAGVAC